MPRPRCRPPGSASSSPRRSTSASRIYGIDFLRRAGDLEASAASARTSAWSRAATCSWRTKPAGRRFGGNHACRAELAPTSCSWRMRSAAARFPWLSTEGLVAGCSERAARAGSTATRSRRRSAARRADWRRTDCRRRPSPAIEATAAAPPASASPTATRLHAGHRRRRGRDATAGWSPPLGGAASGRSRGSATSSASPAARPFPRMPLTVDPSGVYVRSEGEVYIAGGARRRRTTTRRRPTSTSTMPFFEETIWPVLATRIPAFEAIRRRRSWAGHYDFNTLDQNAIVGPVRGTRAFLSPMDFPATACSRRRLSAGRSPN